MRWRIGHDLEAMGNAIRIDTRLIWIANPNNPTGTFLTYPQLKAFLRATPPDVVVVLDEAYNEYIPPLERADTTAWLAEFPNLVVTRTFSKIYGLAGLRIGYALASVAIADLMNRVRQPFNCNNLARRPHWTITSLWHAAMRSIAPAWSRSSPA